MDSSPTPTPTHFNPPVSASTLLSRLRRAQTDPSTNLPLPRLRTGVGDIDSYLLAGGIQRGCVVGVSSGYGGSRREGYARPGDAEGDTGRLITLHILAKSLLERPHSHASIIDSTGSFPLVLLAGVVRWCVERGVGSGSGVGGEGGGGGAGGEGGRRKGEGEGGKRGVEEKVNAVLERVAVTRVFDIEGLWEVLGEVDGGATRGADRRDEAKEASMGEGGKAENRGVDEEGGGGDEQPMEVLPTAAGMREIMDSEEEDDDDDLATQRPPNPVPQNPQKKPSLNTNNHKPLAPGTHPTTEIILLDNLTTLTTTLFSHTSPPLAHRLLSQLSRTLTTISRSSSITIFLLNTLVRKSTKTAGNQEQQRKKEQDKQHSVFAGMTATPSWGGVFDGFVDLHLMCFAVPWGREDAEGVFGVEHQDGEDGDGEDGEYDGRAKREGMGRQEERGKGGDIKFANVIEVLKDECPQLERWEGVSGGERPRRGVDREKRWASFGVVVGVGLVDEVFGGVE
ncbi:hypothetical protein VF21_01660 [Pseudogymnoascus sp. 05NY08]|nr:hypothetical protein VF21_01660 [Pseudogymnoascus sp. 05NY08]